MTAMEIDQRKEQRRKRALKIWDNEGVTNIVFGRVFDESADDGARVSALLSLFELIKESMLHAGFAFEEEGHLRKRMKEDPLSTTKNAFQMMVHNVKASFPLDEAGYNHGRTLKMTQADAALPHIMQAVSEDDVSAILPPRLSGAFQKASLFAEEQGFKNFARILAVVPQCRC